MRVQFMIISFGILMYKTYATEDRLDMYQSKVPWSISKEENIIIIRFNFGNSIFFKNYERTLHHLVFGVF